MTCVFATAHHNQCPENYNVEKLFPHENCGKYYQCVHGSPVERTCPQGLHFNNDTWRCDYPLIANCMKRSEPCQENWTGLIGHEDCNKFYQCDDGVAHEFSCPPGLHFNVNTLLCDWVDNVNCERGPGDKDDTVEENSSESGSDSKPDSKCSDDWSKEILLPHEHCSMFYKCTYGVPVEIACPQGLVYNPETLQCDWPENVDCSGRD